MPRKKSARSSPAVEPLSAHEAGKLSPRAGDARRKIRYSDEEEDSPAEPLTVREGEVLSMLSDGLANVEISN